MRKIFYIAVFFTALLLVLPLLALKSQPKAVTTAKSNPLSMPYTTKEKVNSFRVLFPDSEKIEIMSKDEYIFGVVAAEMPASYEAEALKAQAVAAYSFACVRKEQNRDKDYDISTDALVDQSYIDRQSARQKWGENYKEYEEKIMNAVKAVSGKTVKYKGQTAQTLYHAISGGKTENSADIWGGKCEYLVSVDSVWDKLSPNYLSVASFGFDQLKEILGCDFSSGEIKTQTTKSGTVKSIVAGGKEVSGDAVREKLKLRSANFSVKVTETGATFEVKGYGHGVGMSQYGADYMAKQGSDYLEILKYYYKNVTVG